MILMGGSRIHNIKTFNRAVIVFNEKAAVAPEAKTNKIFIVDSQILFAIKNNSIAKGATLWYRILQIECFNNNNR